MSKFLPILFKKKTQVDTFLWFSDDEEEPTTSAPSRLELAGSSVKEDLTPDSTDPSVGDPTLESMEPSVREDPGLGDTEPSAEDPSIDSKEPSIKMEHQMNLGLATIFSYKELKEATSSFDSSQVIGEGGFGRVYRGKLKGQTMAVKKLKDHLHEQRSTLTWSARIQIAIETTEALTYLHALKPPIIHRDVKTPNILLDYAFHVKVADLGICRHLPWDMTHVSTLPQGTMGYRDPEYERFLRLTDKSDVYNFGVVLLELVSGVKAVDVYRDPENIYLDVMVLSKIKNNKLNELLDKKFDYHSNDDVMRMINSVAELACQCLQQEGIRRPTMVQVLKVLKDINHWTHEINDKDKEIKKVDGFRAQAYLFPYKELRNAMKSFNYWQDDDNVMKFFRCHQNGDNVVYHGNFHGRMVAVKLHILEYQYDCESLFKEVKYLFQLRHDNLAPVYSSTGTGNYRKKMMVVHEYASKGNLGYHLHGSIWPRPPSEQEQIGLNWALRIRIATETAEALLYLHSLKPPFVHNG